MGREGGEGQGQDGWTLMLGEMSGQRRRGRARTRWLDNVMLGEMSGKRRRGRPRTRWLDNVMLGG